MTSKPMKKNGVMTATASVVFSMEKPSSPTNIWDSRFEASPLMAEATMSRMPAPAMMTVSSVWSFAAALTPRMLMYVMKMATMTATASHDA